MVALGHDADLLADILLQLAGLLIVFQVDSFDGNLLSMTREVLVVNMGSPDQPKATFADTDLSLVATRLQWPLLLVVELLVTLVFLRAPLSISWC